ncbi:hypothetical protein [Desulfonatronum parangueonense]
MPWLRSGEVRNGLEGDAGVVYLPRLFFSSRHYRAVEGPLGM